MTENEIAREIVDAAVKIHMHTGPGLFETAYREMLAYELTKCGLKVEREVCIAIVYGDLRVENAFKADLIVESKVIVELKSTEHLGVVHKKQLLTYLRLADKRLGLLINFGAPRIKDGIVRIVNGLVE